jgi:hypothetical protein
VAHRRGCSHFVRLLTFPTCPASLHFVLLHFLSSLPSSAGEPPARVPWHQPRACLRRFRRLQCAALLRRRHIHGMMEQSAAGTNERTAASALRGVVFPVPHNAQILNLVFIDLLHHRRHVQRICEPRNARRGNQMNMHPRDRGPQQLQARMAVLEQPDRERSENAFNAALKTHAYISQPTHWFGNSVGSLVRVPLLTFKKAFVTLGSPVVD